MMIWNAVPQNRNAGTLFPGTAVLSLRNIQHAYEWEGKLKIEEDRFYHVSEKALKKYTMRLLQIGREALMYLVYAIGIDDSKKDKTGKVGPLLISDFPDEWKR